MAWEAKLLADDNKPGADCLAKFGCRSQSAAFSGAICKDNDPAFFQLERTRCAGSAGARLAYCRQDFSVDENSDKKLIELRIARAYVDLLSTLDGHAVARWVQLARIDDHEIRLFLHSDIDAPYAPLFWMELFHHGSGASIDSYACHELRHAVDVFEEFRCEAERLGVASRDAGIKPQG